jgi:hypothetical protein
VAKWRKVLFTKSVVLLPNAAVRLVHNPDNTISAILEAIRPADVAKYKNMPTASQGGGISFGSVFNQISDSFGK